MHTHPQNSAARAPCPPRLCIELWRERDVRLMAESLASHVPPAALAWAAGRSNGLAAWDAVSEEQRRLAQLADEARARRACRERVRARVCLIVRGRRRTDGARMCAVPARP
jgi:hypothetical protein